MSVGRDFLAGGLAPSAPASSGRLRLRGLGGLGALPPAAGAPGWGLTADRLAVAVLPTMAGAACNVEAVAGGAMGSLILRAGGASSVCGGAAVAAGAAVGAGAGAAAAAGAVAGAAGAAGGWSPDVFMLETNKKESRRRRKKADDDDERKRKNKNKKKKKKKKKKTNREAGREKERDDIDHEGESEIRAE